MGSPRMALLAVCCLLAACSAPQAVAAPSSPRALVAATPAVSIAARATATATAAWWDTVRLTVDLDTAIAASVQDLHVPAATGSIPLPAHVEIAFADAGRIDVYRLADLSADYETQLTTLRGVLKDRTVLRTRYPYYLAGTVGNFHSEPGLVAIPYPNGSPAFYARPHYLDAEAWSGVAYLTQFVQTNALVNVDRAVYVVQGISRDGRYLIDAEFSATSAMPRSAPSLPPDPRVADPSFDVFWINFVREIDFRPDAAFRPSLDGIDDMLKTLRLAGP